ncbi:MAG: GNAT family N-acetyltransferase, partial [Roseiarcus sp.]
MANAAAVEIGALSVAEIEAAVALWEEAGLLRPWNDPLADIRLALAGPSSTVLAARAGGRLAATVMVGWDGHRGWIYYLAVAREFRRRGIGA